LIEAGSMQAECRAARHIWCPTRPARFVDRHAVCGTAGYGARPLLDDAKEREQIRNTLSTGVSEDKREGISRDRRPARPISAMSSSPAR
jgi:hypothetical protein